MLQYQPKLYQICPSAYGVDVTSIRRVMGRGITEKDPSFLGGFLFQDNFEAKENLKKIMKPEINVEK